MFWTLLPFGVAVILVLGLFLTASALTHMPGLPGTRGVCSVERNKEQCCYQGKRFAIVDNDPPIRFLSREEFEAIKKFNGNLIEMQAGDIVYLTELPSGKIPPLTASLWKC